MKNRKVPKTVFIGAFVGGVQVKAATTHTLEEAKALITTAIRTKTPLVLDSCSPDESVADDGIIVNVEQLLFFNVIVPNDSPIISVNDIPGKGLHIQ